VEFSGKLDSIGSVAVVGRRHDPCSSWLNSMWARRPLPGEQRSSRYDRATIWPQPWRRRHMVVVDGARTTFCRLKC